MVNLDAPVRRTAEWPADLLDPESLGTSWQPVPFTHFVVKMHSRCNLACDYCYLYEMGDESWRSSAKTMSTAVVDRTAARIGEHVRAHGQDRVQLIVHGGEPLLAGPALITRMAEAVRREVPASTHVSFGVQTNGLLLNDRMLDVLHALDFRVGVSVDGGELANDRHRRFADGRGSHAAVTEAVARLRDPSRPGLFGGLLCVIDLANDPVEVYESLLTHAPPMLDFLLPHGNWTSPPPLREEGSSRTPYGDWIVRAFDRWYDAPLQETRVKLFEDLLSLVLGGHTRSEQVGIGPATIVTIDTDGGIEQVDTIKSAFDGAAATGLSVLTDPLDAALRHPGVVARQIGIEGLSPTCRSCSIRDVCGGGFFIHRYRAGSGFLNPTVYCPDMMRIIAHVRTRVAKDLASAPVGG